VELFDESRMDGIIIVPTYDAHEDIEHLREHRRRVVIVNYHSASAEACTVLMDNVDAGLQAAAYLIDHGARRLAFLTRRPGLQPLDDRAEGIESVADAAGLPLELLRTEGIAEDDGRAVASELLERPEAARPDGIVAGTALMARGLVLGLREGGV